MWQARCDFADWPQWHASLKGVEAEENGLELGKRFAVVPKVAPGAIPVSVTVFEAGRHFTTSSVNPLGFLSFGHSVSQCGDTSVANVTHSICAVPTGEAPIPKPIWVRLKADVIQSVNALAEVVLRRGAGRAP